VEGDHYIVYEHKQSKKLVLATRLSLSMTKPLRVSSDAILKPWKKSTRSGPPSSQPILFVRYSDGSVFLRCVATDCITLEGSDERFRAMEFRFEVAAAPSRRKNPKPIYKSRLLWPSSVRAVGSP